MLPIIQLAFFEPLPLPRFSRLTHLRFWTFTVDNDYYLSNTVSVTRDSIIFWFISLGFTSHLNTTPVPLPGNRSIILHHTHTSNGCIARSQTVWQTRFQFQLWTYENCIQHDSSRSLNSPKDKEDTSKFRQPLGLIETLSSRHTATLSHITSLEHTDNTHFTTSNCRRIYPDDFRVPRIQDVTSFTKLSTCCLLRDTSWTILFTQLFQYSLYSHMMYL